MVSVPQNPTPDQEKAAKEKFDMIYKEVQNNEDFASLARQYSDDPGSAKNGGELPWFGTGRMVPEFEQAAFALERNEQVSQPIRTAFGWHVIKRIDKKDVGSFDEMLPEIKTKISRDTRMQLSRVRFVENLKQQYGFAKDTNSIKAMVNMLDTSIYKGKWNVPAVPLNQMLFEFAGQKHSLQELAEKIAEFQKVPTNLAFSVMVERNFNELVEETILSFEENKLLTENLDFYYLMKEYHDGILLFEITDINVWNKASADTVGLKSFYNQNVSNYQWDKRAHALIYNITDENVAKKAHKLAASKKGQKLSNDQFAEQFKLNGEPQVVVENFAADPTHITFNGRETWEGGLSPIMKNDKGFYFVRFLAVKENEPKPLYEIRGQVVADYQEHLEKEWLKLLRSKHPVKVNQDVFEKMAASLN
jgi:peptidyl-prolyl cis-trans isomerase SurA